MTRITIDIEDVGVLSRALAGRSDIARALEDYETERSRRYLTVTQHSLAVEQAIDAAEYAERYAAFSHWMPDTAPNGRV